MEKKSSTRSVKRRTTNRDKRLQQVFGADMISVEGTDRTNLKKESPRERSTHVNVAASGTGVCAQTGRRRSLPRINAARTTLLAVSDTPGQHENHLEPGDMGQVPPDGSALAQGFRLVRLF